MRIDLRRLAPALVALASGGLVVGCRGYQPHGSVLQPPAAAPDFTLTDAAGGAFTLSGELGKVVVLYFGYTSCPDVCPTTLADLSTALGDMGPASDGVEVAMVTVDPARDAPERLASYMTGFHPRFRGLTGSPEELAAVYKAYNVTVERHELPQSALGYSIDHSATLFVIDPQGRLVELFLHGTPPASIAADLSHLVQNGA